MTIDPKDHALARADAAMRANDRKARGSRMSDADEEIIDAERHLRNALLRSGVAASMARMLAKMTAATARARKDRVPFIDPGRKKLAEWGQCDVSSVKRNFTILENCKVIVAEPPPVGRGYKRRFRVDAHGLKAWINMRGVGARPELFSKLERILNRPLDSLENPEPATLEKGSRKGVRKGVKKGVKPPCNTLESGKKICASL